LGKRSGFLITADYDFSMESKRKNGSEQLAFSFISLQFRFVQRIMKSWNHSPKKPLSCMR